MVEGREGGRKLCYDIPPGGGGAGQEMLIRGTVSTTQIRNGTRPHDPGGGEVQLAASWDVAVAWQVLQPTSQPTSVMVVTEELQRDVWTCLKSGPSFRGRDAINVNGTYHSVGAPADALQHVAEECADFAGVGAVVVAPPAVFAGVVAADVTALTDAGMVTVVVADAGTAFQTDLAGVVAADVATLADAGMVTVGVVDLADAGMAVPADPAGVVTVGGAFLADAREGTVGVSDLADAGRALPANLAGVVTMGVAWDGVPSRPCWIGHRRCD